MSAQDRSRRRTERLPAEGQHRGVAVSVGTTEKDVPASRVVLARWEPWSDLDESRVTGGEVSGRETPTPEVVSLTFLCVKSGIVSSRGSQITRGRHMSYRDQYPSPVPPEESKGS